jgi:hypothetical protein
MRMPFATEGVVRGWVKKKTSLSTSGGTNWFSSLEEQKRSWSIKIGAVGKPD